jgi:4-diphosphocytidyl-2-C-methyl-D-erythritol kinase
MNNISGIAYTRITLALDIIRKIGSGRFSGYHELNIIKHQIKLYDRITLNEADVMSVECDSPFVPLDNKNICVRAVDAVRKKTGIDKNVKIIIEKNIPVMGGLAGGSADAAATLDLVNRLWNAGLSSGDLAGIGMTLGMDVPYFFTGHTAFDTEATGIVEPINTCIDLDIVLAVPEFGVSTREAYSGIDYGSIGEKKCFTDAMKAALLRNDINGVAANMHNDFEISVFRQYPELYNIKKCLLDAGCMNAIMSGSGSTLIGIIGSATDIEKIRKTAGCRTVLLSSTLSSNADA